MIQRKIGRVTGVLLAYLLNLILISPLFIVLDLFTEYKIFKLWLIFGLGMMFGNFIYHRRNQK